MEVSENKVDVEVGEEELEFIKKEIKKVFGEGKKNVQVFVFGSRVRSEQRRKILDERKVLRSDLDLAFLSDEDISFELSVLRESFEESNLPFSVDVVDLSKSGEDLKKEVLREGKLWISFKNI